MPDETQRHVCHQPLHPYYYPTTPNHISSIYLVLESWPCNNNAKQKPNKQILVDALEDVGCFIMFTILVVFGIQRGTYTYIMAKMFEYTTSPPCPPMYAFNKSTK